MSDLVWETKRRKIGDLVLLKYNPRSISKQGREELVKKLEKFNLVEIPVVNTDNTVIAGNQRVTILKLLGRENEMIDVRVPNRKLTRKEIKEYALLSNQHDGQWDLDILGKEFKEVLFDSSFIFDIPGVKKKKQTTVTEHERSPIDIEKPKKWQVTVECDNEDQAQELYEKLSLDGMTVKIQNPK